MAAAGDRTGADPWNLRAASVVLTLAAFAAWADVVRGASADRADANQTGPDQTGAEQTGSAPTAAT